MSCCLSLLRSYRRLRSLEVSLVNPHGSGQFTLPLSLAALPEGLTRLQLRITPAMDVCLPAGDYLRCLQSLELGPLASLRLTPLLPFMPQVAAGLPGVRLVGSTLGPHACLGQLCPHSSLP